MTLYDQEAPELPLQDQLTTESAEYSGNEQEALIDSIRDQVRLEELQSSTNRQVLTMVGGLALMGLGIYSEKKGVRIGEVPFYGGFGINVMAGIHMWLNSLRINKIEYSDK